MNKKRFLTCGGVVLFVLVMAGIVWALCPAIYNRPTPLMDYVPQEIGIYDTQYHVGGTQILTEGDCRSCHGNSLADRHHATAIVLRDHICTGCHEVIPDPPGVVVIRDCTDANCHGPDTLGPKDELTTPPNGWHHTHDQAASENCIACHDPNLIEEITPFRDHQMYPPTVVTPTPFSCENCHWEQDNNPSGWVSGQPAPAYTDAGHPSTYDHFDPWGNPTGYYEYGKAIRGNFDTHHMGFEGLVASQCYKCHSQDPENPEWNPYDPEIMRYCEICHSIGTLHTIVPHVGTGGTGNPPAVRGWEAVGFHVAGDPGEFSCVDADPTVYRTFTANEQCFGCHGDALPPWDPEVPPAAPEFDSMSPIAGSCGAIVTIRGRYFGSMHTTDRSVVLAGPVPATSPMVDMPIHAWTDTLIEFELPCWTFAPGNYYVQVRTETGNSTVKVFTVKDHPTALNIAPANGPCRQIVTISGSGGFDPNRNTLPSGTDGYHGISHVVDFVCSAGMYTATLYAAWSDTSFQVMFGDVFEDQVDPNTGERNFVLDDGTGGCPPEPLIRRCEDFYLGIYNVYVKAIYYGDDDSSNSLTCGDTIFEVEKSDPVQFELINTPVLYKLNPWSIERSYYCNVPPMILINNILTIYGQNFGPTQNTGDVVKIGTAGWYASNPFTNGIVLPRVQWGALNIRVGIDKPYVPDAAVGNPNVVIWVIKDGTATNALPLTILPDSCP